MWRVLVRAAKVGVGVEPEAVEAQCADSAPRFALAVVNCLDVPHRAH